MAEPATDEGTDAEMPHQMLDTASARRFAFRAQRGMHPGAAVAPMVLAKTTTDIA